MRRSEEDVARMQRAPTVEQWERRSIEPLQRAVLAVPPLALRADVGALQTAGPYMSAMADLG